MRRTVKRLTIAGLLSASCYAITHFVYQRIAPNPVSSSDRDPIAYVSRVSNEVERRPIKRTIWQSLSTSEPVYPGEAIRTAKDSEARLQFVGSGKTLDLEPESLIVLTSKKNEVSLELLDGGAFVAQTEGQAEDPSQKLTLKSDAGQIDLSKATVSLSKAQNQAMDLQVLKGSATLSGKDGPRSIEQGQSGALTETGAQLEKANIKILAPRADAPIYIAGRGSQPQQFDWEGAPKSAQVVLWMGESRKELKPVNATKIDSNSLKYTLSPGRYFWKLVAKDSAGKVATESATTRLEIKSLAIPSIIQPQKSEFITLQSDGLPITFQWSVPVGVTEVTLEMASDPKFLKVLFSEKFEASDSRVDRILPTGKYHWRVSGYYPEYKEMISSVVQPFEVWVKPPKVINISWDVEKTLFYAINPKAELKWTATKDPDIKKWRLKIAPTEADLSGASNAQRIELEVTELKAAATFPKAGRWVASLEALDKKGQILSKSETRSFDLQVLPLLASPVFLPETGDLNSTGSGDINLKWRGPAGAVSYSVTLTNSKGRTIATKELTKTTTSLTNLMPGNYEVEVKAKDQYGRISEVTGPRHVIVPENSGLSAPKVKRIQVN